MYKRKIFYRVEKRVLKLHNNVKICCSTEVSFLMLIWILVFQFDPPLFFFIARLFFIITNIYWIFNLFIIFLIIPNMRLQGKFCIYLSVDN